jgi:hypothetical protein
VKGLEKVPSVPTKGDSHVSDVLEAESLWHFIRTAVVQTAAPEDSADPQYGTFYDAEAHDACVEVFGAGWAIDAVSSQKRGDQLLISFYWDQEYFPCNVSSHVIKIASGWFLCNPRV